MSLCDFLAVLKKSQHPTSCQRGRGFTLVEMMMVVVIIGFLLGLAVPKMAKLIEKSREGSVRSNLSAFRAAITLYYGSTEGLFPSSVGLADAMTTGEKYLSEIKAISLPNPAGHLVASRGITGTLNDAAAERWYYMGPNDGRLFINCTHEDATQRIWSTW